MNIYIITAKDKQTALYAYDSAERKCRLYRNGSLSAVISTDEKPFNESDVNRDRQGRFAEENTLTAEAAETLLKSDWKQTIKEAVARLPKAKNGRPYIYHSGEKLKIDVPASFADETKKEILKKNDTKLKKIAALWAIQHIEKLFEIGEFSEPEPDIHKRPNIKQIIRVYSPFFLEIDSKIIPFSAKFTVREFENGRKVLSDEILEINGGRDLGLYALSTEEKQKESTGDTILAGLSHI